MKNLDKIKEKFSDIFNDVLCSLRFICPPLFLVAPSLFHFLGWEKVAVIVFIVLLALLSPYLVFAVVMVFLMMRNQNADQMTRWMVSGSVTAGSILVGTIIAKIAGIF